MELLRPTWLVFGRAMRQSLRNPVWVIMGLITPVLYLTLFGPLLEPIATVPGFPRGSVWQVFVPGLLLTIGIFGAAFVGFGLISEWRAGVVERMRVTPVSRAALLLGRALRDVVVVVVQAVILTVTAVLLFDMRAPWVGVLVGIVLVGVLGLALASVSYAVALRLKSEDALAPLMQGFTLPVLLLSGILLPLSFAPDWLWWISRINPFSYIVEGARAAFLGDVASQPMLVGGLVTLALVVVSVSWGTRTFQRESS